MNTNQNTNNKKMNIQTIQETQKFVSNHMKHYDASHDYQHVMRVVNYAKQIYQGELESGRIDHLIEKINEKELAFIIEMSALIHDVNDHKYSNETSLSVFLINQNVNQDHIELILYVVENVSFSKEKKHGTPLFEKGESDIALFVLNVVRDADRLDAIGAIGIARTFIFSYNTKNPIYEPGKSLNQNEKSTVGHFYEKLLLLKDGMKNPFAKSMAQGRHDIMVLFLEQLKNEICEK